MSESGELRGPKWRLGGYLSMSALKSGVSHEQPYGTAGRIPAQVGRHVLRWEEAIQRIQAGGERGCCIIQMKE